jgi:hypothetical protein
MKRTVIIVCMVLTCISVSWLPLAGTSQQDRTPEQKGFARTSIAFVDEAGQNQEFLQFRTELLKAIDRKDKKFLLNHIDPKISISFGGECCAKGFLERWELDKHPEKSKLWKTLGDTLKLGGKFSNPEKTIFTAPYLYDNFPKGFDEFEYSATTAKDVAVHSKPDSKSEIIDKLSFEVVKQDYQENMPIEKVNGEEYPWVEVVTYKGEKGYVFGKYVRSAVDFRAFFELKNNKWMMTVFISGD